MAGGRPKGSSNAKSMMLKQMILNALDKAGGEDYLKRQAEKNPNAFLALIGKTLPLDMRHSGGDGKNIKVDVIIAGR